MIEFSGASYDTGREVADFLNFVKLSLGRPTPYAGTIGDVRENVGLDDNFESF